jgi:hypothetical protein
VHGGILDLKGNCDHGENLISLKKGHQDRFGGSGHTQNIPKLWSTPVLASIKSTPHHTLVSGSLSE